jgi:hypothetical protein
MFLVKKHFPPILEENTMTYFKYLEGIVESVDENAEGEITRKLSGINIRISPSEPKYFDFLLKDVEALHNHFGIRMDYSKSMKSSGTINFDVLF